MSPWQLIRLNVNTYSISASSPRNTNARDPVAGVADPGGADGAVVKVRRDAAGVVTVEVIQILVSDRRLMLQNRSASKHRRMIFPQLVQFTDIALFLLRVMVGLVFITSGWNHLKSPEARSKDIETSKGFILGVAICLDRLGSKQEQIGSRNAIS